MIRYLSYHKEGIEVSNVEINHVIDRKHYVFNGY